MPASPHDPAAQVRLAVNLSPPVADALQEIAERRGWSITEAIRRCVSTQKAIEDAVTAGGRILLDAPGKRIKELRFDDVRS